MLRMALPKGKLLNQVHVMLRRIGFEVMPENDRDYSPACNDPNIETTLRKVRAIPQLIGMGNAGIGFCGLDLVRENQYNKEDVLPLLDLGLNPVRIVVATSYATKNILVAPPECPLIIATEYEHMAREWAMSHGLSHIIIQTHGSTESYVPKDAHLALDNVDTGQTMAANDLHVLEEIMLSSTWLIANRTIYETPKHRTWIDTFIEKLQHAKESSQ